MKPTLARRAFLRGCAACAGALAPDLGFAEADELRFGLTPVFLTSDLELLSRLKIYLERATGRRVKMITRRTYQEITSMLISRELDAAWICGYPFVANAEQLALVAVPIWRGKPLYQSYLIAGKGRNVRSLIELKGDIHAFSDPDSNSGYLVTAAEMAALGTSPDRFFSRAFFTYGHRNVVRAVDTGLAASGSVDGYIYEVLKETEPDLVAGTEVVRKSTWLGFPPIACPASLDRAPVTMALRDALARMPDDPDGRAVLAMLRLDGFREEPAALYAPIAELMRSLGVSRG
ncbi:phosphonate transport system substrate-binding protein [Ciceribacter lividus]|uniref:Phosphonate transport system substrate-binding protein n=1 Tax=Ciceribacter lividus TaxID=1197950 RepID=A0A6I7HLZ9_9HYPH|nr:PhnD/SsuA/transferrin family substrate-binding protein [Ciceribacter lividus]RCW22674.1 phosphonate transport system substrate-binding protein [Ciceribacter lividus]